REEVKRALTRERQGFFRHRLAMAHRDYLINNLEQARLQLGECPADLRDDEWRHLHRLCHAELVRFRGQTGRMVYSRDGRYLATAQYASDAGTIQIWDVSNGRLSRSLRGHLFHVVDLAFSPDGKRLISVGHVPAAFDGYDAGIEVKTWDPADGMEDTGFSVTGLYKKAIISPDARRLALVQADAVRVCDAVTGRELFSLRGPLGFAERLAFRSGAQGLATAGTDRTLRLWDGRSGELTRAVPLGDRTVVDLAFSPDGRWLAEAGTNTARTSTEVRVWDGLTDRTLPTLRAHTNFVNRVTFSPDGRRLASGGSDSSVILWDLRSALPT